MNLPEETAPLSHEHAIREVVNRAARDLITALPYEYDDKVDTALGEILDAASDEHISVLQLDSEAGDKLHLIHAVHRNSLQGEVPNVTIALDTTSHWWLAQRSLRCVVIQDQSGLDAVFTAADARALGILPGQRTLLVPLSSRGFIKGCLCLQRRINEPAWNQSYCDELIAFGDVLGSALEHRYGEFHLGSLIRENRALMRHIVQVQEEERKRLSQALHDETGQYLTALKSDATVIAKRAEQHDESLAENARAIVTTAKHIYEVVYDVMGQLSAMSLVELGLRDALQTCIANSRLEARGVKVHLSTQGDLDALEHAVSMTLYRVTQEALTNIAKYANASDVEVKVARVAKRSEDRRQSHRIVTDQSGPAQSDTQIEIDSVELSITDDGDGFDTTKSADGGGYGVRGMRERFQALGGSLAITSHPGQGSSVHGELHLGARVLRD